MERADSLVNPRALQIADGSASPNATNRVERAALTKSLRGNRQDRSAYSSASSSTMRLATWVEPPRNPFVPLEQGVPVRRSAQVVSRAITAVGYRVSHQLGLAALKPMTTGSTGQVSNGAGSNGAGQTTQSIRLDGVHAALVLPRAQGIVPFHASSQFLLRPGLLRQPISLGSASELELTARLTLPDPLQSAAQDVALFAPVLSPAQPLLSIVREPVSATSVDQNPTGFSQGIPQFSVAMTVPEKAFDQFALVSPFGLSSGITTSILIPELLSDPVLSAQVAGSLGSDRLGSERLGSGPLESSAEGQTNNSSQVSRGASSELAQLSAFVEQYSVNFAGVVVGPVNMAILATEDGVVVIPSGGHVPGTEIVVGAVTTNDVVLNLGEASVLLKRLP